MAGARWCEEERRRLRELMESGDVPSLAAAAAEMARAFPGRRPWTAATIHLATARFGIRSRFASPAKTSVSFFESSADGSAVLTLKSKTIRTLDVALREAKVDLRVWRVERWIANKWDQGQKRKDGGAQVVELWQVKVWLRRIAPKPVERAVESLMRRLTSPARRRVEVGHRRRPTRARHMLEMCLFDAHIGKLCWGKETGDSYDVQIAVDVYRNAAEDLLGRVRGYAFERVLFPVGQDLFQVDNWMGTTERGTAVDFEGRFQRTFEMCADTVRSVVNRLAVVAPVKIVWVPGNHDPATSWYLVKFLEAYYRREPRVVIDSSPSRRKYERYGTCLVGYTHGHDEPHRDLPTIMAGERPADWAATTERVWHVGHGHRRRETRYSAGDTFGAVSVVAIPSLSGTDAWHYSKGYVKTRRLAQCYLWSRDEGLVGRFEACARLSSKAGRVLG
jgi:hypothetical protein